MFPSSSFLILALFLAVLVPSAWGICKESDNFVFECQLWEDVAKLPVKGTVKQLIVKNASDPVVCDASTLKDFPSLSVLSVQPGPFTEIQEGCFEGLKYLQYVQIMENKVKSINLESLNRSVVERLWLDGNQLKEVQLDGIELPVLRSLGLSNNFLEEIDIKSTQLPDLRILDLSYNNLTKVSVESVSASFLKLHGNLLANLSAVQLKGKFMQMLYLSENKLTEIRSSFFAHLPRAEFVHFEKNPVKLIDLANFNVTALKCLDGSVSITRKDMERQLSIDLSWDKVEQMILSNNSLNRLDIFNFTKGPGILELLLDHNQIREVKKDDLKQLDRLVSLDMSHNKISYIEEGALDALKDLHTLSLAHNCLQGVSAESFLKLTSLFQLDLSRNIMTYFLVNGWNAAEKELSFKGYHVR